MSNVISFPTQSLYRPTLKELAFSACDLYNVSYSELLGGEKLKFFVLARKTVIWNATHYGYSSVEIGKALHCHYSTILYHIDKMTKSNTQEAYQ